MMLARKPAGWILVCCVSMIVMGCATSRLGTSPPKHAVTSDVTGPAVSDVPEASDAHAIPSKVTKVTVYSDRARVTRQSTV